MSRPVADVTKDRLMKRGHHLPMIGFWKTGNVPCRTTCQYRRQEADSMAGGQQPFLLPSCSSVASESSDRQAGCGKDKTDQALIIGSNDMALAGNHPESHERSTARRHDWRCRRYRHRLRKIGGRRGRISAVLRCRGVNEWACPSV